MGKNGLGQVFPVVWRSCVHVDGVGQSHFRHTKIVLTTRLGRNRGHVYEILIAWKFLGCDVCGCDSLLDYFKKEFLLIQ